MAVILVKHSFFLMIKKVNFHDFRSMTRMFPLSLHQSSKDFLSLLAAHHKEPRTRSVRSTDQMTSTELTEYLMKDTVAALQQHSVRATQQPKFPPNSAESAQSLGLNKVHTPLQASPIVPTSPPVKPLLQADDSAGKQLISTISDVDNDSTSTLASSSQAQHPITSGPCPCSYCGFQAKCKQILKVHSSTFQPVLESDKENVSKTSWSTVEILPYAKHIKPELITILGKQKPEVEVKDTKIECPVNNSENNNAVYRCNTCDFSSKWKQSLKSHMKIHALRDDNNLWKCEICPYQTLRKGNLTKHLSIHQPVKSDVPLEHLQIIRKRKSPTSDHSIVDSESNDDSKFQLYYCEGCEFNTKYKQNMIRHDTTCHSLSEVMYGCKGCSYRTNKKGNLQRHCNIMKHNMQQ